MTDDQLVQATLQEYHDKFPDQQFDIATVFLWNILHYEQEEFASTLRRIIKPGGFVIISYVDEAYDKGSESVPKLMSKFFREVQKFRSHHWYMLKCSVPFKDV